MYLLIPLYYVCLFCRELERQTKSKKQLSRKARRKVEGSDDDDDESGGDD